MNYLDLLRSIALRVYVFSVMRKVSERVCTGLLVTKMENNIICPFNTAKQHRYKNILTSIKLTTNFKPWEWALSGVCPRSICISDDKMTAYLKQVSQFMFEGLCSSIIFIYILLFMWYVSESLGLVCISSLCVMTLFSWMIDSPLFQNRQCVLQASNTQMHALRHK